MPLTGLNNRRAFYEIVTPLWNKGIRKGHEMAVMILDLDRFKQLNDTYGHQCGDEELLSNLVYRRLGRTL